MLRKILICLLKLFGLYEDKSDTPTPFRMQTLYEIKPFMTEYERRIYSILLKFDKDCNNLLMLIEIDDSTHNSYKRRQRDEKVNNICHDVGIKILHFYTSYPNEEGYVLNRILKNLNNNIDNKVSNTEENNTYTLVR